MKGKKVFRIVLSFVLGFMMFFSNDVFVVRAEEVGSSHSLAKKNITEIHDIFAAKDDSKLEKFKARIFNRLFYKDEEIDVSDIDISPNEIQYISSAGIMSYGEYAARNMVRFNNFHSTISVEGFPTFTYKDNGNVATVKYTYESTWTEDLIKKAIVGYDEAMSLIKPGDSDFAKALKLHDWIVKNVSYGMSKAYSDFAVGALANRSAVCGGYAQCYQFLLSQVGVVNITEWQGHSIR